LFPAIPWKVSKRYPVIHHFMQDKMTRYIMEKMRKIPLWVNL
jgi:hypothetical protein